MNAWIILPTDKAIKKFDFVTGVLVFYDSFMIPFKNTFGTGHFNEGLQKFLYVIEVVILFVFITDVVLGFRRAYLNDNY